MFLKLVEKDERRETLSEMARYLNTNFIISTIDTEYLVNIEKGSVTNVQDCLLYTSPSPRDRQKSRMPSCA